MGLFNLCSGPCVTCNSFGEMCLASNGNDNYILASKENLLKRLENLEEKENKTDDIKKNINIIKGTLIVEYDYIIDEAGE